ncbi:hypothetical protein PISMIDRAFT_680603 [Pisolithus microcarpus 441]|uniref:Uncharacterized protein n=1 Tax=Pisolithus microcarpus 441 TaxID=765257 RepID=A0A0C9YZA7_9AGAM|nr:hypothetical protein PISMIDRAFT_680603 [Pisolithus microcarpus 441]
MSPASIYRTRTVGFKGDWNVCFTLAISAIHSSRSSMHQSSVCEYIRMAGTQKHYLTN